MLQGKLVGWRRLRPGGGRVLWREGERHGHLGLRLRDGGGGGDDGGGLGGRLEDGLLHLRALHALHDDGRVRLRLPRGPRLQCKGGKSFITGTLVKELQVLQREAPGLTQGFVIIFHVNSTGGPYCCCSPAQASNKMLGELLNRNVQNLYVRPSAPRCRNVDFGNVMNIISCFTAFTF